MERDIQGITERVVAEVTAETDQDPLELPPLYETIDPEALDSACEALDSGKVTFQYANHFVTVRADQTIEATVESQNSLTKHAADD